MHRELIQQLRKHALALVNLARKLTDPDQSLELEAIAVDLLKRASNLGCQK
jgi:hypothetical protein